ncbi:hypothetical protein N752_20085 [Desulforamulus aquiferis]|nr:hypothetical protein [Desulforamulus aquiferis]RYD03358.1 hypothetical protein N752_20085 [Desulforamulus aquiferis]
MGNEVTIYKMDTAQNEGAGEGQRPNPGQEEAQNNPGQGQQQGQAQSQQGQRPENMGPRMVISDETETFIIPVGTPIVMLQRGSAESSTVALTEIKKDQMLRIWKQEGEISLVQVIGSMGAGNRQGQGQGGRGQGMGGGGFGPPQEWVAVDNG